jgi:hypothetical protein
MAGDCIALEERAGRVEVRSLSCRWIDPGKRAQCDVEQRFVALYFNAANRPEMEVPEPWYRRSLKVRSMPNGGWCAEN